MTLPSRGAGGAMAARRGRPARMRARMRARRRAGGRRPPPARAPERVRGWRRRAAARPRRRERVAHEVALRERAAHLLERPQLLLGLDFLGDDGQLEIAAEDEDRLQQPAAVVLVVGGGQRAAVDLEEVDRHPLQVGAVGVAAAEVVDRDPDAELAQVGETAGSAGGIEHDGRLGDLEDQVPRLETGLLQRALNVRGEAFAVELVGGDLDGKGDVVAMDVPGGGVGAGLFQDPAPDRHDQAALLGQRDEVLGSDLALAGCSQRSSDSTATTPWVLRSKIGW